MYLYATITLIMFGIALVLAKDRQAMTERNLPIDRLSPKQKLISGIVAILLGVIMGALELIAAST
jgi:hypothetical protein